MSGSCDAPACWLPGTAGATPTALPLRRFLAAGSRPTAGSSLLARGARAPGRGAPVSSTPSSGRPALGLHDAALLPDAEVVVARTARARARGERVLVVGDFDADGLTGLAILVTALRRLGLDVAAHVPSRVDDGPRALAARGRGGPRGRADAASSPSTPGPPASPRSPRRSNLGIDVIVTDHHRVPDPPPPAAALVNPHRPDAVYPDRRLAGSGVALKVAALLLERLAGIPAAVTTAELADLATIGTVADVAPILGENRSIARLGLDRMRTAPRPGVAALLAAAGVAPAAASLETVAFDIAPRLNAAGRVGEAHDAADLLLADDRGRGRRRWPPCSRPPTRPVGTSPARRSTRPAPPLPGADPDRRGHPREGAVAGRRRGSRRRPARRGARSAGGRGRRAGAASCGHRAGRRPATTLPGRSPPATTCSCGTAATGARPASRSGRSDGTRSASASSIWWAVAARPIPGPSSSSTSRCPARAADYRLLEHLAGLAPTGPGNPDPIIGVHGLTVTRIRAAAGGHAQLTLRRELDVVDAIAFAAGRPGRSRSTRATASTSPGGLPAAVRGLRDAPACGPRRGPRARCGRRKPRSRCRWPASSPAVEVVP